MSDVKLGELLNGGEQRDAIHVAIAPVMANCRLKPGEHIGFIDSSTEIVGKSKTTIGVVDPFLKLGVDKGERFYMFLYPNTVTGMRHHWSHPSFVGENIVSKEVIDESVNILRIASEQGEMSYSCLIESMDTYAEYNDYQHMGENERYKHIEDWDKVWDAWAKVTGKTKPVEAWCPFSCSC